MSVQLAMGSFSYRKSSPYTPVIPAKAGIQRLYGEREFEVDSLFWAPAFPGVTVKSTSPSYL